MLPEVIIISGTGAPPFGIRHYPYAGLIRQFEAAGYTVHLENIYHLGIDRMDRSLQHLQKRYFSPQDRRRYIVCGHSQGGLLALALGNEYPDKVVAIELFGAPLYGTRIAPIWLPLPAVRAMNHRSRWLKELRGHENLDTAKVHSYFSALDVLVVPWVASMVKGGHNYLMLPSQIEGLVLAAGRAMLGDKIEEVEILHGTTGHIGLVTHPTVLGHLAGRYEFGAPSKLVVVAS